MRCYICLEGLDGGDLVTTGCACRGDGARVHVACCVEAARVASAARGAFVWVQCPVCTSEFTGAVRRALGESWWSLVTASRKFDVEWLAAANNLGNVLLDGGFFVDAERAYQAVHDVQCALWGPEDPETLKSAGNIGTARHAQGHYAEAATIQRAVVEAKRRLLGPGDVSTLQSEGNLAMTLSEQGSFAEAEQIEVRVVEGRARLLGADHPHTLAARGNLAKTLYVRGEYARAADALRAVLAAEQRVLGPEHPATLVTHTNLAVAVARSGDEETCAAMCAAILPVCERVLGVDSLDTLACAAALANATPAAEGAREMRRIFEAHVRLLGDEHPQSIQSAHALAVLLTRAGAKEEARALLARAFRVAKRALGADHRGTRAIEADLDQTGLKATGPTGGGAEEAATGGERRECGTCGQTTTRVCGRCRAVHYCSRECQRAGWRAHAGSCRGLGSKAQ